MTEDRFVRGREYADADPLRMAAQLMKNAGLAATVPRMAVWRIVAQSDQPLDAKDIKHRLIDSGLDIAMSSIYLALRRLTDVKLLSTCAIAGRSHYYPSSRRFRQRLVCRESGEEYWFSDSDFGRFVEGFCRKHGFTPSDYTLSVQVRRVENDDCAAAH